MYFVFPLLSLWTLNLFKVDNTEHLRRIIQLTFPETIFSNSEGNCTDNESCVNLLSSCFRECLSVHKECAPNNTKNWLPTRLIDISPVSKDYDTFRIVERDSIA